MHLFARESALKGLDDEEADDIINEVVKLCETDCKDASGRWTVMYVRLRFCAILQ